MTMPLEARAAIAWFLELSPGIQADAETLTTLLDHIEHEKSVWLYDGAFVPDGLPPRVTIDYERRKKASRIFVGVHPGLYCEQDYRNQILAFERRYAATSDGLLAAIVDAKGALTSMKRGWCETCLALEPPRKKLKGKGLPSCAGCVLSAALGCRSQVRAGAV